LLHVAAEVPRCGILAVIAPVLDVVFADLRKQTLDGASPAILDLLRANNIV
jgi:hypothetical protein